MRAQLHLWLGNICKRPATWKTSFRDGAMVRVHSRWLRVVRSDCQLHNRLIGAASSGSRISKHDLCLGIPETSISARTPTLSLQMLDGMLIHADT